jgi:hypothetical protein
LLGGSACKPSPERSRTDVRTLVKLGGPRPIAVEGVLVAKAELEEPLISSA